VVVAVGVWLDGCKVDAQFYYRNVHARVRHPRLGIDSNGQWQYVNGEGVGTDLFAALNITDTTGAQSYINGNSAEVAATCTRAPLMSPTSSAAHNERAAGGWSCETN